MSAYAVVEGLFLCYKCGAIVGNFAVGKRYICGEELDADLKMIYRDLR